MEKLKVLVQALFSVSFILATYAQPTKKYKPSCVLGWSLGLSLLILTVGEWLVPGKAAVKGTLAYWLMCIGVCNFVPLMIVYLFQLWKHQRNQKLAEKRSV